MFQWDHKFFNIGQNMRKKPIYFLHNLFLITIHPQELINQTCLFPYLIQYSASYKCSRMCRYTVQCVATNSRLSNISLWGWRGFLALLTHSEEILGQMKSRQQNAAQGKMRDEAITHRVVQIVLVTIVSLIRPFPKNQFKCMASCCSGYPDLTLLLAELSKSFTFTVVAVGKKIHTIIKKTSTN